MFYSQKLQKAINFATMVHIKQTRKGKKLPYIIHPFGIALILARSNASEDIICAGILHDTIEDCEPYGSVTKEVIEKEFGEDVARIVNDVTEQDVSLPWDKRKQAALDHIKHMQHDSLMVKSADVLQNLTDQIEDYKKIGDNLFKNFNASKEKIKEWNNKRIGELEKAWDKNPILPDLKEQLDVFNKLV